MLDKELSMAARLIGIERFLYIQPSKFVEEHKKIFSAYFDVSKLIEYLKHDNELINRARSISFAENEETFEKNIKGYLSPVFNRLNIGNQAETKKSWYPYEKLTPSAIFPTDKENKGNITKLQNDFVNEIKLLEDNLPKYLEHFMVVFDRILLSYTWCISSSDYVGEDISLYDHMKITQATVNCISESREEKPYCLLMGAFSGIQKYIFSIANTNNSGVAKRLRARSFYVDVMIRVFAQYIIDKFMVGRENILMQTGGKFYVLLPNSENMNDKLNKLSLELEQFLYEEFKGTVSINLAWIMTDDNGLKNYSETLSGLYDVLDRKKTDAFSSVIKNADGWCEERFIIYPDLAGKHLCKGCSSEMISNTEEVCGTCKNQLQMGKDLANAKYIIYEREDNKKNFHIFKDYYIKLVDNLNNVDGGVRLVECLTQENISDYTKPITIKYMANHVPQNANGVVNSFSEIADTSNGIKKISVLKADVDVLGFLFAEGLRKGNKNYGTISRVNGMSRMLELFFSGYINELLSNKNKGYDKIYSVFSGGDDLFLIGPWDVIPTFALSMRSKFKEFVANNPCVTLSAAVSIFGSKAHISHMAEVSETNLDNAKNTVNMELYPKLEKRNKVYFLGDVLTWEDFEKQIKTADMLLTAWKNNKSAISISMLRRIAKYSDMYRQVLINKDNFGLMYEPLLNYDRARNYNFKYKSKDGKVFNEELMYFDDYVKRLHYFKQRNDSADYRTVNKELYYAKLVVKYVLNITKEVR